MMSRRSRVSVPLFVAAFGLLLTVACRGEPASRSNAATATTETALEPTRIPRQQLLRMVEQHFFGSTNTGKDRLNTSLLTPLGGKFGGKYSIVIDFNANDAETPDLRNRGIEVQMVDGFELLYRADLSVSDATISARFPVKGFSSDGVVYTTRLTAEVADTIDWDRKAEIDFTALWEVVFQHPEFQ